MPEEFTTMPVELRGLLDLADPDIEYIADSILHLKAAGLEVTDPDIIRLAVHGGHKRAAELEDDSELKQQQRKIRAFECAEANQRYAERLEVRSKVYYARVGNRCKIGTTLNIQSRMARLVPEELLVVERGGPILEAERHRQFSALHSHGREWFRYEGALVAHVAELRAAAA